MEKLQVLLLQKPTDPEYYSLHIISNNNIHYISYVVNFIDKKETAYTQAKEKIKKNGFKSLLLEKGFDPYNFNFDNPIIKVINFNNLI